MQKYLSVFLKVFPFAILLHPVAAHANFSCNGHISYLGSDADGAVEIDIGKGTWKICSLSTIYQGVTAPEACQGWYSLLISAKLAEKSISIYFNSDNTGNDGITSCENLGNWTSRMPYHIALL